MYGEPANGFYFHSIATVNSLSFAITCEFFRDVEIREGKKSFFFSLTSRLIAIFQNYAIRKFLKASYVCQILRHLLIISLCRR